ncbi:MFS transporter [Tistrella bauzanensis]|uniref:MFS transporter n=1 Tax=Tistrella bauzanensis TaxID=657419 RepID=A0ABQ1J3D1_9PROT|nr:MFS transporter [Tistrella bauzanensis]GGB59067.1 MFS transporter [Tistrella bauzanensis]
MTTLNDVAPVSTGPKRLRVLGLCFLVVLLDGLDTTSIAFVAPVLAHDWGLPHAGFTPAFVATSLGAALGYMLSGKLSARLGIRGASSLTILLFGAGTLATAAAWDIASLSVLRLVSAIGLGGVLPIAIAAAAAAFPARHKETVTMIVASGLSAGGVAGGLIGGPLMRDFGWESVFVVGGVAPLLVLPLFLNILPRAVPEPAQRRAGSVGALFHGPLAMRTSLLWSFAFLIFLVAYTLVFWIPTLLVDLGFAPQMAALGGAAFGMGGLIGNVVIMTLVGRVGINRLLMVSTALAMVLILILNQMTIQSGLTFLLIGGLGAGLITGCVGQAALAVSQYGGDLRITGVGWSSAIGRIGAIVGPAVGGMLLAMGYRAQEVIVTALLPAAIAILILVVIRVRR